jgi:hypothetical protein
LFFLIYFFSFIDNKYYYIFVYYANIGTNSLIINSKLKNKENHVVVEPLTDIIYIIKSIPSYTETARLVHKSNSVSLIYSLNSKYNSSLILNKLSLKNLIKFGLSW